MKTLLATRYVTIPEGITLDVKSRVVTVTGPRGELVQSFKHVNLDLQKTGNKLRVDLWFGTRKQVRVGVDGVIDQRGCARGAVIYWIAMSSSHAFQKLRTTGRRDFVVVFPRGYEIKDALPLSWE